MADINPVENPLGALQQMALQRAQSNQTALDAKRAEYDTAMGKFEELANAPTPEAARWGAMAKAAAQVPPMVGGFGALLANIGGAYGQQVAQDEQQNFLRQQTLMKLKEDYLKKLEDQQSKFLSSAKGSGGAITQVSPDGTIHIISRQDGSEIRTIAPEMSKQYLSLYETYLKDAMARGEVTNLDDARAWAKEQAAKDLPRSPTYKGAPVTSAATTEPADLTRAPTQGGSITPPPSPTTASAFPRADDTEESLNTRLQIIQEEMQRYGDNPEVMNALRQTERGVRNRLFDLRQKTAAAPAAPASPQAAPLTMPKKDVPKEAQQKAQAEQVGKDIAKEGTMLNDAMHASNKMISQLDLMEKLYSNPNMPQGELANMEQTIKSSLASMGIKMGKEVGQADMARALATSFALHLRTGEGQNLLPGSMSNYEDQMLQKMAPSLSLTQEGRMALIQFMRETAKSNARLGHEFNQMTDDRGIVSPEWRKRKERVMKEEMARLARVNRDIMSRFQGDK